MNTPLATNTDQTGNAAADHTPGQLYDILGRSVALIPASEVQATAMVFAVPPISLKATKTAANQQDLISNSIAVVLGKESQGLCAILFQDTEILKRFVNSNQVLHTTLQTSGPKGWIYWVRILGVYPPTRMESGVNWLSDGVAVVLHSRNTAAAATYKIAHSVKPIAINFSQLHWPEGIEQSFQFDLSVIRHGAPRFRGGNGRWVVNTQFWSAYISLLLRVQYHPQQRRYYKYDSSSKTWQPRNEATLLDQIAQCLTVLSRLPDCDYLLDHRNPTQLRALLAAMQITASDVFCGESSDELERLLLEMLEPAPGATVTTAEMLVEHKMRCLVSKRIAYPDVVFLRRIPAIIERHFYVRKSRRVLREGTMRRGYNHIRIKSTFASEINTAKPEPTRDDVVSTAQTESQ